jgi:hypothetical protein
VLPRWMSTLAELAAKTKAAVIVTLIRHTLTIVVASKNRL